MKNYYYMYVFCKDMYGTINIIKGKLFFDIGSAIDSAKRFASIPGNHVQVFETSKNIIVYER